MELTAIERLLNKYLEGESSLKEEEVLRSYFCSGNVAPHLQEYIPLFAYFNQAKEERYARKIEYGKEKKKTYSWVAVAASIVLLAGIFLQEQQEIHSFGSYEDPEIALQKTKETLQMVSQLMNNGKEDLIYIKEFNEIKNSFLK